ncbi:DUF438 domain-containing protein [candidate division WOR-3 bacterium]|uniref:DUF438 domain-containing protein n=1 Tax=candidate division WOR-3 bacterium TaxID=2052148 RepID=A0A9D5K9A0_UNCW3|nr:DUF438 domain-containing protein [candidate division WOR-3 bacterium]MBD3364475.1 DUF438 domain-containing protein [candidate division WOR-3 bacterium]
MLLGPRTPVAELLREYPFLENFLPEYNPKFKKLLNPVVRNTIGKIATLRMAASDAEIEINTFIKDLKETIETQTGEEVRILTQAELAVRAGRIRQILADLHSAKGSNVEELRKRFAAEIEDINPSEIAEIEQQLISEGITEDEITSMCDLHVAVFRDSLDKRNTPDMQPGHPVHTFRAENAEFEKMTRELSKTLSDLNKKQFPRKKEELAETLEKLTSVNIHYTRKENQLFPYLEKYDIEGPVKVMWNVHDQIRQMLKKTRTYLESENLSKFKTMSSKLAGTILDMIYKEERILFPMALEKLNETQWAEIREGEGEIGYALVEPGNEWNPAIKERIEDMSQDSHETDTFRLEDLPGNITRNAELPLSEGALTLKQIDLMLKTLPLDISFVDERDEVRYYSATPDRIFPRSRGVIGRKVQNCHPPKSVHIVEKILDEFKNGKRDSAEFWIQLHGKFLHIRYFALRDGNGNYKGTLEVSQDVTGIRKLTDEKRLLDWE